MPSQFACNVTAGSIMFGLVKWSHSLRGSYLDSLDIPENLYIGGLWVLAEAISKTVTYSPIMEHWDNGVFEYEHCDSDAQSIWLPVVDSMTSKDWLKLCSVHSEPVWLNEKVTAVLQQLVFSTDSPPIPLEKKTFTVSWAVDLEGVGSHRKAAESAASAYFKPHIAAGEPDSACVFFVTGADKLTIKVDLSE